MEREGGERRGAAQGRRRSQERGLCGRDGSEQEAEEQAHPGDEAGPRGALRLRRRAHGAARGHVRAPGPHALRRPGGRAGGAARVRRRQVPERL